MATILVGNGMSQLVADPAVLRAVRHSVAYQAEDLPPVSLQVGIKRMLRDRGRQGFERDAEAIYHGDLGRRMEAAGWGAERLDRPTLESVMRTPGAWDGWVGLVDAGGWFGSGLVDVVQRAVEVRGGVACRVVDQRTPMPPRTPVGDTPELRDYQLAAATAFLQAGRGVIDLPPRSGKTRIAAYVVHRLGLRTLYVTPQRGLVVQAVEAFRRFLPRGLVQPAVGGMKGAKHQRALQRALVWVATPQTAVGREGEGMPGIETRELLVVDEFHHAAATTYQQLGQAAVNAWWRLGLTGTHYRSDGRDLEMTAVVGGEVFSAASQWLVSRGHVVPLHVAMLRVGGYVPRSVTGHDLRVRALLEHPERNGLLVWAVGELVRRGKRVLVLAKEVDHTKRLAAAIPGAVQVDGETGEDGVRRALVDLEVGRVPAVVGTSVIGEGRDVPAADALVYAPGGRSRVKVVQDSSRVRTAAAGKRAGIVVDMADVHSDRLLEDSAQRLAIYRSEPTTTAAVLDPQWFGAWCDGIGR